MKKDLIWALMFASGGNSEEILALFEDMSYFFYKNVRLGEFEGCNAQLLGNAKNLQSLFEEADDPWANGSDLIISQINTQNCENMDRMFYNAILGLANDNNYAPEMDASKVKTMVRTFYNCKGLKGIPQYDTSQVKDISYCFGNCAPSLETVPQLDLSNVEDANNMFYWCSNLTSLPVLNFAKCKNISNLCYYCQKLTAIEGIDLSSCTNTSNAFSNCTKLARLVFVPECTKVPSFSIKSCNFDRAGLVEMFESLPDMTGMTGSTITITSNPGVADLTDEDRAIAVGKNFSLVE